MLLITYWSDQSNLPIDRPEVKWLFLNLQHRLAHLLAFGLLGLLAGWAFEGSRRATLLAILLTSVFGAADELHQSVGPGRRAGIDDWLFDTFSAAVALYVWPRLQKRRPELRIVGPVLVGAVFALGVLLMPKPILSRPPEINRAALRDFSSQVLTSAREVARQVRAMRAG
jgi:VanZ family protein